MSKLPSLSESLMHSIQWLCQVMPKRRTKNWKKRLHSSLFRVRLIYVELSVFFQKLLNKIRVIRCKYDPLDSSGNATSPFFMMNTYHGKIIVNRNDELSPLWGVGSQIMRKGSYDMEEISLTKILLRQCLAKNGPTVTALDCGANIGIHSIEWGKLMADWGQVFSYEAQLPIYYALCGGLALNGCLNVFARHMAIGDHHGTIEVPYIDYSRPSSFGSLELNKQGNHEWIGQEVNYENTYKVNLNTIDSFKFQRVDLIKIDVEGMEVNVLMGALQTLGRCKPVIIFEHAKSDRLQLESILAGIGYNIVYFGNNALGIHKESEVHLGTLEMSKISKLRSG